MILNVLRSRRGDRMTTARIFTLLLLVVEAARPCSARTIADAAAAGAEIEPKRGLISDGQPLDQAKYPWSVSVYAFNESGFGGRTCSGVLLTSWLALTSAECIENQKVSEIEVLNPQSAARVRVVRGDPVAGGGHQPSHPLPQGAPNEISVLYF